jgi:Mce-associated membrane protein
MSTQNPNTPRPRRRIAGERKGQRSVPVDQGDEATSPQAPAGPLAPRTSRPAGPPPPPVHPTKQDVAERPPGRPVPWPMLAGLALMAVVLLVLAAGPFVDGMGWKDYREVSAQSDVDSARRTAPAQAERAAAAILAYDYKSLESDRDAAAQFMTPAYRKQYLDTFDSLVIKAAKERKAHVEASVRASGVTAAGADRVEVLLFVNQTTTSTANSGNPQTALNRVMFTMVRQGETWRVDDITSY